jgi:hypothetical protein
MTNQNQPPVPVSGLAAVLAIVQAVVAVVPRWLVVAAGVVFVAWLGFDLYLNARQKLAQTEAVEVETQVKIARQATESQKGVLPMDLGNRSASPDAPQINSITDAYDIIRKSADDDAKFAALVVDARAGKRNGSAALDEALTRFVRYQDSFPKLSPESRERIKHNHPEWFLGYAGGNQ